MDLCPLCEVRPPVSGRRYCSWCRKTRKTEPGNRIYAENKRAQKAGLEGSLTFKEWMVIGSFFCIPDPGVPYSYLATCAYCGQEMDPFAATIEHWIPISLGGSTNRWNCIPSCDPCNFMKMAMTGDVFFRVLLTHYPSETVEENYERAYQWFERMDAIFENFDLSRLQRGP